jgi:hypothetical protein
MASTTEGESASASTFKPSASTQVTGLATTLPSEIHWGKCKCAPAVFFSLNFFKKPGTNLRVFRENHTLASTSMEQGRVAVCHAFGFQYKQRVASMLPMGIYTIPEISAAGETEDSCKKEKIGYEVGRARYENNARGHIAGDTAGLLKLVFSPPDKKLLGVSIIGESATELIHIGMMVLDNGSTINEFIEQVFNYPTLSEMYKYAAYDGLGNLAGHKLREG